MPQMHSARQRQPCDQHAPTPKDVAGAGGQQQKAAEDQRVDALHPGQAGVGKAEVLVNRGQTGEDDGRVKDDHHVTDQDDGQDGALVGRVGIGRRHGCQMMHTGGCTVSAPLPAD
jgi:hypothetical protein